MNVSIREYKRSDYESLIKLLYVTYGSQATRETIENIYLSDTRSVIVAVSDNNDVVGCVFLEIQEDYIRPGRVLYLTYVAVDEKIRKQGIGRALICYAEDECRKNKCSAIEFTSANYRIGAHIFYEKLGYSKKQTTVFIKEISE